MASKWQTIFNSSPIEPWRRTKATHYNEAGITLAAVTKIREGRWKLLLVYKPEVIYFSSSTQARAHAMKELI